MVIKEPAAAVAMKLVIILTVWAVCTAVELEPDTLLNDTSCPPWYSPDKDGECSFIHQLPNIVRQYGNSSELEMGFCMTVTNTSIVVGQCPYTPVSRNIGHLYHNIYQVLPTDVDQVNSSLCAPYNRRGFLCSECKEGHGLAVYRYYGLMCVKCSHPTLMLIAYLALLFIPPTIFFFSFLILKIDVHSGNLSGFIYFSHILTTTIFFFPQLTTLIEAHFSCWPVQIVLSLYGVWSLSFMRFLIPLFCVNPHLTTLQLVSLGYVPSVYILTLCIVTYYLIQLHAAGNKCLVKMWKPFKKCIAQLKPKARGKSSIIHTFGTFILLSYGENIFISFSLLQSNLVISLDPRTNTLKTLPPLAADMKTPFFGPTHAPYAVLGIVGGVVTVILPLVLVLIFPTRVFPKLIPCCGLRRWHAMRTFMEVFTSSYKDGTETGQRDFRFTAAVYLIGRIATGLSWIKPYPNSPLVRSYGWLVSVTPCLITAACITLFRPHRRICHNTVDVLLLLLLAKICCIVHFIFKTHNNEKTLKILVSALLIDIAIPQVVVMSYFVFKLVLHCISLQQFRRVCLTKRRVRQRDEASPLLTK